MLLRTMLFYCEDAVTGQLAVSSLSICPWLVTFYFSDIVGQRLVVSLKHLCASLAEPTIDTKPLLDCISLVGRYTPSDVPDPEFYLSALC